MTPTAYEPDVTEAQRPLFADYFGTFTDELTRMRDFTRGGVLLNDAQIEIVAWNLAHRAVWADEDRPLPEARLAVSSDIHLNDVIVVTQDGEQLARLPVCSVEWRQEAGGLARTTIELLRTDIDAKGYA